MKLIILTSWLGLPQALLLGLLGLWPVLVHQLKQLGGGLPVQGAV